MILVTCFRRNLSVCLALLVAPLLLNAASDESVPAQNPKVHLKVEIERGNETHRFTVFIYNDSGDDFVFLTGARGGPGSLDDRKTDVFGTPPTPVVMNFAEMDRSVTLTSPSFGGAAKRSLQPEKVTVKAGQRLEYASFAVPAPQVVGTLVRVYIPDETKAQGTGSGIILYGTKNSFIEKKTPSK
jgi:hypothetical protein